MAVVSFKKGDLENLVGKRLSDDILKNKIPMMGCPLGDISDDEVEFEVFPDRPDLLSIEGFARAVRYFLGISKGLDKYKTENSGIELHTEGKVKVRPYITAGVVKNIELDEKLLKSLMQLQEKIHKTFGRERKKVAIGIHDLDKVEPPFTYKAVKPDKIEFVPLQSNNKMNLREIGEKHPKGKYVDIIKNSNKWPIIVDNEGEVLSFPPVINGKITELGEDTENLFLDLTGTDEEAINQALNLVATTLAERGGKIEFVEIDGKKKLDLDNEKIGVNLDYVNNILGLDLTMSKMEDLVRGMGFGYSDGSVLIPPYRTDIMHPIDIVEDIAIRYGYDNFESNIPPISGIGSPDEMEEFCDSVREIMIGYGFQEVITSIFTNEIDQFDKMELEGENLAKARNALNENYYACRKYIIPKLLEVLKQNKHRSYPQKIFEVEDVVDLDEKVETGAKNVKKLAGAISNDSINYTNLASKVKYILNNYDINFELKGNDSNKYIEGRSAKIVKNGNKIGEIGEIHPQVLENWVLERPVVAFEINLEKIKSTTEKN